MGLFGRKRRDTSGPDEEFAYFTRDEAARFRGLVRESFAEAGLEVTVYSDHLVDSAGAQYGLGNLAAACHNDERGERAWPAVVRDHVRRILAAMQAESPFDTMSADEIRARTYLRVIDRGALLPGTDYAPEIAPGIAEVLNLDLPETVAYFTDDQVDRFGPFGTLRDHGIRNLRTVAIDDHDVLRNEDATVHVISGESVFTASLVLLLDEVARRLGIPLDPDRGAFVAIPFRHQLVVHPIRDTSAIASLPALAHFASLGFSDSVGPVSPHAYWWRRGELNQLTRYDDDGRPSIVVEDELATVLENLPPA